MYDVQTIQLVCKELKMYHRDFHFSDEEENVLILFPLEAQAVLEISGSSISSKNSLNKSVFLY